VKIIDLIFEPVDLKEWRTTINDKIILLYCFDKGWMAQMRKMVDGKQLFACQSAIRLSAWSAVHEILMKGRENEVSHL
jgi:hypothetical protein